MAGAEEPVLGPERVLAHSDQAIVLQKGLVELSGASEQVAQDPALPKLLGV